MGRARPPASPESSQSEESQSSIINEGATHHVLLQLLHGEDNQSDTHEGFRPGILARLRLTVPVDDSRCLEEWVGGLTSSTNVFVYLLRVSQLPR